MRVSYEKFLQKIKHNIREREGDREKKRQKGGK